MATERVSAELGEEAAVEATPQDLEAEQELTQEQAKWASKLSHEVSKWKAHASTVVGDSENSQQMKRDIHHLQEGDFSEAEIELYHAFVQAEKGNSAFYKTKFGKLARAKLEELSGKFEDPAFCLARLLQELHKVHVSEIE